MMLEISVLVDFAAPVCIGGNGKYVLLKHFTEMAKFTAKFTANPIHFNRITKISESAFVSFDMNLSF